MAELTIKFELDTQSPEVIAARQALDKAIENYKNALASSFKLVKEEPTNKTSSKCDKPNCQCGVQPNGDVVYCNPRAALAHLDAINKASGLRFFNGKVIFN